MWYLLRGCFRTRNQDLGDPGRIPGGRLGVHYPAGDSPATINPVRNVVPVDATLEVTTHPPSGILSDCMEVHVAPTGSITGLQVDPNDLPGTADQVSQVSGEYVMRLDESLYRYSGTVSETVSGDQHDDPAFLVPVDLSNSQSGQTQPQSPESEFHHPDGGFSNQTVLGSFGNELTDRDFTAEFQFGGPLPTLATVGGMTSAAPTQPQPPASSGSVLDDLEDTTLIQ